MYVFYTFLYHFLTFASLFQTFSPFFPPLLGAVHCSTLFRTAARPCPLRIAWLSCAGWPMVAMAPWLETRQKVHRIAQIVCMANDHSMIIFNDHLMIISKRLWLWLSIIDGWENADQVINTCLFRQATDGVVHVHWISTVAIEPERVQQVAVVVAASRHSHHGPSSLRSFWAVETLKIH